MQVTKEIEWDMGHRVPNHKSKCRNVHGHRYLAQIVLEGDVVGDTGVSEEGMVIDFGDIKTISKEFIDNAWDHGYMGQRGNDSEILSLLQTFGMKVYITENAPTAENIAKMLFDELEPKFKDVYGTNLKLRKIKLWETPSSFVEYDPDEEIATDTFKKGKNNVDTICLCQK